MKSILLLVLLVLFSAFCNAEDGYRLWLRYDKIDDNTLLQQYKNQISSILFYGNSPTLTAAKNELKTGLQGLLDKEIADAPAMISGSIVLFTKSSRGVVTSEKFFAYDSLGKEGFII